VTFIFSRHTLPLAQHNTTKNDDLDPLKNTQHFSASHTEFSQRTKGLHLLQKDLKSIQDENPIPHFLDQNNLKAKFNSFKSQISEKLKSIFFY